MIVAGSSLDRNFSATICRDLAMGVIPLGWIRITVSIIRFLFTGPTGMTV